jgi:Mg2+ and Co2+ transporter CorA
MNQSVNINMIYKKLTDLEKRITVIENLLIPKIKVNKMLAKRLENARREMKKGKYISLSELKYFFQSFHKT